MRGRLLELDTKNEERELLELNAQREREGVGPNHSNKESEK